MIENGIFKLTEFTVKRSEWFTGLHKSGLDSALAVYGLDKDEDRYKLLGRCCLGFAALACGYTDEDIRGTSYPRTLPAPRKQGMEVFERMSGDEWFNSDLAWKAATINDDERITNEEREQKLIALFKAHGIEVTFVD